MPGVRHLQNAPITEAIFDLRVKARHDFDPHSFTALEAVLKTRFPRFEQRRVKRATFQILEGKPQPTVVEDLGSQGYFLHSSDGKLIAQFRVDGFTLNRLKPYTSWSDLYPTVKDLWRHYCEVAKPEVVTRLAVRYVNQIALRTDAQHFRDALTTFPAIPDSLPQEISGFLIRVTIKEPSKGIAAHLLQSLEPGPSVLLDIDAFCADEFSPSDPRIESVFQDLRELKNRVFFHSLSEDVLRQFE